MPTTTPIPLGAATSTPTVSAAPTPNFLLQAAATAPGGPAPSGDGAAGGKRGESSESMTDPEAQVDVVSVDEADFGLITTAARQVDAVLRMLGEAHETADHLRKELAAREYREKQLFEELSVGRARLAAVLETVGARVLRDCPGSWKYDPNVGAFVRPRGGRE